MSLYDDASLALLTGAGAGKDGKLYVAKPAAEFGDELITNGGFDTDTDWTLTGSASISGGVANFGASGDYLITNDTPIPLSVKQYRIEYEVVSGNAGALRFAGGSSAFPTTTIPSTVGTHIVYVTSNGTQSRLQFNSVGFIGSIDNVSVKEVLVNADFEFTRGSNLAATRVNSDGLIEKGRENLLTYSNDFSQWIGAASFNITTSQTGYDGATDASSIEVLAAGAYKRIRKSFTHSGVTTFSVYAKANTENFMYLYFDATSLADSRVWFDLSQSDAANVIQTESFNISASVEDAGNGWYRCSITGLTDGTNDAWIGISNADNSFNADANGSIYIQDAQVEIGLAATDYIESGASTGKAGLLENEPRFDYSGGATCPSLLLEWSRTQLVKYSEYFEAPAWQTTGSPTLTTNTTETNSPEGIKNATLVTSANATSEQFILTPAMSVTSGNQYTFSFFAKKKDFDFVMIRFQGNGGSFTAGNVFFNISIGSVATEDSGFTGEIKSIGNGWYRCSATSTASATTNAYCRIQLASADNIDQVTGDGSKGTYIYGAQFEEGSYPTSYIPNYSDGSVTRSSEASAFELSVLDFFSLSNTESGTFFIETKFIKPSTNSLVDTFSQGGSGVNIWNGANFQIRDTAGSTDFTVQNITSVVDDYIKIIIRKDLTTYNVFINGVKSSTTATITNPLKWFDHIALYRNSQMVKQMIEFPEALTDVECIKLTEL